MSSDGYQAGHRSEQGVGLNSGGVDQLALTKVGNMVWGG